METLLAVITPEDLALAGVMWALMVVLIVADRIAAVWFPE